MELIPENKPQLHLCVVDDAAKEHEHKIIRLYLESATLTLLRCCGWEQMKGRVSNSKKNLTEQKLND